MIDRSKLSPAGEKTMVEIEAQLMELCKQLTASVQRMAKPSRREQRRARKARKNLVMYKTAGRRPWNVSRSWHDDWEAAVPHDPLIHPEREYIRRRRVFYDGTLITEHLREPSGFLDMSRRAEGMR